MSPIAKALVRARYRHINRLAVGVYEHPVPAVYHEYVMAMLAIAVRIECGVAPAKDGAA